MTDTQPKPILVLGANGVRRLMLLSGRGEEGARQAEVRVENSGADWTLVRCAFFNQNFSETFVDAVRHGVLAMPGGDTAEPFLDADDIADVVCAALTDDRHIGKLHELTGPRLLTLTDAAAELSNAMGREVRYLSMTPEEYASELVAYGLREEEAVPISEGSPRCSTDATRTSPTACSVRSAGRPVTSPTTPATPQPPACGSRWRWLHEFVRSNTDHRERYRCGHGGRRVLHLFDLRY